VTATTPRFGPLIVLDALDRSTRPAEQRAILSCVHNEVCERGFALTPPLVDKIADITAGAKSVFLSEAGLGLLFLHGMRDPLNVPESVHALAQVAKSTPSHYWAWRAVDTAKALASVHPDAVDTWSLREFRDARKPAAREAGPLETLFRAVAFLPNQSMINRDIDRLPAAHTAALAQQRERNLRHLDTR
jgi:hypothetical protein